MSGWTPGWDRTTQPVVTGFSRLSFATYLPQLQGPTARRQRGVYHR